MTTQNVLTFSSNCPSREEMFDSLRLGVKVNFILDNGQTIEGTVSNLEMEDGSRHSWLFKLIDPKELLGSYKLHGYINTRGRRRGHFQALDDSLTA